MQRKVEELTNDLHSLLDNQNVAQAKEKICQIFDLYFSHYKKGMHDLGMGILRNNGFLENRAVHFDVSKMSDDQICDPLHHRHKTIKMAKKMADWVENHYPCYYHQLISALENHLSEVYKEQIAL